MKVTTEQLKEHTADDSCWVVIKGTVYDVTAFLNRHPGGKKAIMRFAGKDATEDFELIHPENTLQDNASLVTVIGEYTGEEVQEEAIKNDSKTSLPALEAQLSLEDFEKTAHQVLAKKAWAYYFSASDDLITKNFNNTVYHNVLLRPRIFVDVAKVDTSSSILGISTKLPVFVSPAAMARMAHPSGEKGIAQACDKAGVVQIISNNASMKFADIADGSTNTNFFFQLYVQYDRAISEKILKEVIDTGRCKGIVLTLDAPWPGKREMDDRTANEDLPPFDPNNIDKKSPVASGVGKALFAGTSASLVWDDLRWLKSKIPQDMKIIVKGLQTWEDAEIAAREPLIDAIFLSNHGGRAMDQSQPPLLVLAEIRKYAPQVLESKEVYLDGGIKRGTDVVKALCLGAKQVGIGRPVLYGLSGYGAPGVERTFEILADEISTAMRLLGVTSLSELGTRHVNTRQLDNLIYGSL